MRADDLREEVEQVCRDHGWRSVGPLSDLPEWLRARLRALDELREEHSRLVAAHNELRSKLGMR